MRKLRLWEVKWPAQIEMVQPDSNFPVVSARNLGCQWWGMQGSAEPHQRWRTWLSLSICDTGSHLPPGFSHCFLRAPPASRSCPCHPIMHCSQSNHSNTHLLCLNPPRGPHFLLHKAQPSRHGIRSPSHSGSGFNPSFQTPYVIKPSACYLCTRIGHGLFITMYMDLSIWQTTKV